MCLLVGAECGFCCLAWAFLVFRTIPLQPFLMLYSPGCVEVVFCELCIETVRKGSEEPAV
jgi:hypothetical protein